MSALPLSSLFRIILEKKSTLRFLVGTIGSLSFSIAVILATIGLMDGFEISLKKALSHSNGDIKFRAKDGFFLPDEKLTNVLQSDFILNYSTILQIETFAIGAQESKGVLLRGIEPESFGNITGIKTESLKNGILIGKQFQKKYKLAVGDSLVLAFASGKKQDQGSAHLQEFIIDGVVEHGIYEKDFRFMYIEKQKLIDLLAYREATSNFGIIKIKNFENINDSIEKLKYELGDKFRFDPYWSEFEVLLEAVEIEKISISIVLQLIVVVAILNVVGFIIFLSETKAQDFFMLRALGLSIKSFQKFWFILLGMIWAIACLFSKVLLYLFSEVILELPFIKIPGDIYVLSNLQLILDPFDYLYVFGISLGWILLIGFLTMRKLKKNTLLGGLRREFS